MGFIAGLIGLGWVIQHIQEILFFAGILIVLIIIYKHSQNKKIRRYQAQLEAERLEKERLAEIEAGKAARAAAQKIAEEAEKRTVSLPEEVDDKPLAYKYLDVRLDRPENLSAAVVGETVSFQEEDNIFHVIQNGIRLGDMPQNRLSGMISDWNKSGDPIYAFVNKISDSQIEIALGFYQDTIGKFLARNQDAKLVKLIGKPEELAFYNKGEKCEIEHDLDTDHYLVMCDGSSIGRLPASAITYAEKHDIEPDMLEVIIAEIDYDADKDRDIISVYISD